VSLQIGNWRDRKRQPGHEMRILLKLMVKTRDKGGEVTEFGPLACTVWFNKIQKAASRVSLSSTLLLDPR
jgi:hypothetical protein